MASTRSAEAGRPAGFLGDVPIDAVLDASPNAVIGVDQGGRIGYVNPVAERTFGYAQGALIARPIEILLPEALHARHVGNRDGFISHPVARPMGIGLDLLGRRADGTHFPVEISLAPVRAGDGLWVFATVVDITARKAAEFQLLQAQKLESIGRLAGGIAHDFNNMMFAVRGYADLLREDLDPNRRAAFDPDTALEYVDALDHAAERASTLTAQLLAFSRRQVVVGQVLDVNDAVAELEPMIRPIIGEQIRLNVHLDPSAGRIRVDRGQLDQVIVNLVVNARDALPSGGAITIETSRAEFDESYAANRFDLEPGSYVLLAVSDNGSGMDADTLEHIFEPFFTTKDVGRGTGLGLATIHGIVRQAGGHVWVYSEPTHGSVFKLFFPRVDGPVEAVEPEMPLSVPVGGRALVVEDDPIVRDMTSRLLARSGMTVVVADPLDVLTMDLAAEAIDVLVTDVVMPGATGTEIAVTLMDRNPRLAIVLLSGYTEETLDLRALTDRGAVFLSKPATASQLLGAVQRAIAGRGG